MQQLPPPAPCMAPITFSSRLTSVLLPLLAHRALLEHCQGSLFPTGKHSLVPLTPHIQHRVCAPGEPRAVLAGARHLPQEHWDKTTAFTNPSGGSVPPAQGAPQGISQQPHPSRAQPPALKPLAAIPAPPHTPCCSLQHPAPLSPQGFAREHGSPAAATQGLTSKHNWEWMKWLSQLCWGTLGDK